MSELNLVEQARLGNVAAIATLMNASLHRVGIQAQAALQGDRLYVLLESDHPPAQQACLEFIQLGLAQLQRLQAVSAVIYGRVRGQALPSWIEQIDLVEERDSSQESGGSGGWHGQWQEGQTATVQIPTPHLGHDSEIIDDISLDTGLESLDFDLLDLGTPALPTGPAPLSTPVASQAVTPAVGNPPSEIALSSAETTVLPAGTAVLLAKSVAALPELPRPRIRRTATAPLMQVPRSSKFRAGLNRTWYLSVLRNDRLFFGLLLGVPLLIVLLSGYILNRYVLSTPSKPTAVANAQAETQPTRLAPAPQTASKANSAGDAFEVALQRASMAVELGQSSKTEADWQKVTQEWQGAIAQMKALPQTHPKYAIAQLKVKEYQQHLAKVQQGQSDNQ
jgi:hypothetical protein